METLKLHPEVCLSAVTRCKPVVGPKDNSFTLEYRSAIAFGRAETVTDETERIEAMRSELEAARAALEAHREGKKNT